MLGVGQLVGDKTISDLAEAGDSAVYVDDSKSAQGRLAVERIMNNLENRHRVFY